MLCAIYQQTVLKRRPTTHISATSRTLFSAAALTLVSYLICYCCCWATLISSLHGSLKNAENSNRQWNLSRITFEESSVVFYEIDITLVKCWLSKNHAVEFTKLLSSYSWKEVWATDRPFIRCRCFQRFSGCHAMAHSARLDNNNNTSNPSPASALYYKSTFNKRRQCAWWVFFSTQFADRLRNASINILGSLKWEYCG